MEKMGFQQQWIDLVMRCMETVHYNFLLNGEEVGHVFPTRGLRQGDPISPYLFIIGLEGLSRMFQRAEARGSLHGVKVCSRVPSISHLFFADDSFIFCKATLDEVVELRSILCEFELCSGQSINLSKSEVSFSSNLPMGFWFHLAQFLGLKLVEKHGTYLGFPLEIGTLQENNLLATEKSVVK